MECYEFIAEKKSHRKENLMSEKSKWQEKGVCPECGLSIFLIVKEVSVDIKTGKVCELYVKAKCPECRTKFEWVTPTGRITRAKK